MRRGPHRDGPTPRPADQRPTRRSPRPGWNPRPPPRSRSRAVPAADGSGRAGPADPEPEPEPATTLACPVPTAATRRADVRTARRSTMMLPRTRSFSIIQPRHLNDHQKAAFFYAPAETGATTPQPAIRSYLDLAKALRSGAGRRPTEPSGRAVAAGRGELFRARPAHRAMGRGPVRRRKT